MRALLIVLTDESGGAERVAGMVANELARHSEWTVEYLVLTRKRHPSFSEAQLLENVTINFRSARSVWFGMLLALPYFVTRRFDLVFTTHIYSNAFVGLLRRLRVIRAKRIVARDSTAFFDRFGGLKGILGKILYRLYFQDLIVAQTGYMKEHVTPHLGLKMKSRISVVPNPVDIDLVDLKSKIPLSLELVKLFERNRCILFCGRLIDVKQPGLALQAFAIARREMADDVKLVFVGDGPLYQSLRKQAQALGIGGSVVFMGNLTNPYNIMRACKFGLLTSSHEGFPNVLLEMMSCGIRKIVSTPCAGDLDTLSGVVVSRDFDRRTLARALVEIVSGGEDSSASYREVVTGRSIGEYLRKIVGEVV